MVKISLGISSLRSHVNYSSKRVTLKGQEEQLLNSLNTKQNFISTLEGTKMGLPLKGQIISPIYHKNKCSAPSGWAE